MISYFVKHKKGNDDMHYQVSFATFSFDIFFFEGKNIYFLF
jgi:hypothetical protein